jgi:hypothetical protein
LNINNKFENRNKYLKKSIQTPFLTSFRSEYFENPWYPKFLKIKENEKINNCFISKHFYCYFFLFSIEIFNNNNEI